MDINAVFADINQKFNIRDKNRLTQFFLMTAAVLFADLSWAWLRGVFEGERSWYWVIAGSFMFLVLLTLNWLMMKASKLILAVSFFVVAISFLTIFGWNLEYIVIAGIAIILFMIGSLRAIKEKNERINIKCFKIFRLGLPMVITGLSLMLAIAFFFSPLATNYTEIKIPRPLFNFLIMPLMSQITDESPASEIDNPSPSIITLEPEILKKFDIVLSEDASQIEIENAIYQLANKQINQMTLPYIELFPYGLAIVFFAAAKSIGYLMMYLVIFVSWLIFRMMVSSGAIKINVEPSVREIIEI